MSLKNLTWTGGGANPSGIASRIFAILNTDITTWPAVNEDNNGYKANIQLASTAKAAEIYSTQGTGKLEFEQLGEKDCAVFNNKGTFSYPDLSPEACAFVNNTLNDNYTFVAAVYNKGNFVSWRVIGSPSMNAEVKITGTSGQKVGDAKGLTFEISAPDFMALPTYEGTITTSTGVFDCATNSFTPAGA